MGEMEEKLNSVLNNPALMQQIMNMAQNMNAGVSQPRNDPPQGNDGFPDIDIRMLQKLSGFAQKSSIDANQKSLLSALGPYLSHERIGKLEKAMRAARMAQMASVLLNSGQFQGR